MSDKRTSRGHRRTGAPRGMLGVLMRLRSTITGSPVPEVSSETGAYLLMQIIGMAIGSIVIGGFVLFYVNVNRASNNVTLHQAREAQSVQVLNRFQQDVSGSNSVLVNNAQDLIVQQDRYDGPSNKTIHTRIRWHVVIDASGNKRLVRDVQHDAPANYSATGSAAFRPDQTTTEGVTVDDATTATFLAYSTKNGTTIPASTTPASVARVDLTYTAVTNAKVGGRVALHSSATIDTNQGGNTTPVSCVAVANDSASLPVGATIPVYVLRNDTFSDPTPTITVTGGTATLTATVVMDPVTHEPYVQLSAASGAASATINLTYTLADDVCGKTVSGTITVRIDNGEHPAPPTFSPNTCGAGTYVIPSYTGVTYQVKHGASGTYSTVAAGTYNVTSADQIYVIAVATSPSTNPISAPSNGDSYILAGGQAQWPVGTFATSTCVAPTEPVYDCGSGSVQVSVPVDHATYGYTRSITFANGTTSTGGSTFPVSTTATGPRSYSVSLYGSDPAAANSWAVTTIVFFASADTIDYPGTVIDPSTPGYNAANQRVEWTITFTPASCSTAHLQCWASQPPSTMNTVSGGLMVRWPEIITATGGNTATIPIRYREEYQGSGETGALRSGVVANLALAKSSSNNYVTATTNQTGTTIPGGNNLGARYLFFADTDNNGALTGWKDTNGDGIVDEGDTAAEPFTVCDDYPAVPATTAVGSYNTSSGALASLGTNTVTWTAPQTVTRQVFNTFTTAANAGASPAYKLQTQSSAALTGALAGGTGTAQSLTVPGLARATERVYDVVDSTQCRTYPGQVGTQQCDSYNALLSRRLDPTQSYNQIAQGGSNVAASEAATRLGVAYQAPNLPVQNAIAGAPTVGGVGPADCKDGNGDYLFHSTTNPGGQAIYDWSRNNLDNGLFGCQGNTYEIKWGSSLADSGDRASASAPQWCAYESTCSVAYTSGAGVSYAVDNSTTTDSGVQSNDSAGNPIQPNARYTWSIYPCNPGGCDGPAADGGAAVTAKTLTSFPGQYSFAGMSASSTFSAVHVWSGGSTQPESCSAGSTSPTCTVKQVGAMTTLTWNPSAGIGSQGGDHYDIYASSNGVGVGASVAAPAITQNNGVSTSVMTNLAPESGYNVTSNAISGLSDGRFGSLYVQMTSPSSWNNPKQGSPGFTSNHATKTSTTIFTIPMQNGAVEDSPFCAGSVGGYWRYGVRYIGASFLPDANEMQGIDEADSTGGAINGFPTRTRWEWFEMSNVALPAGGWTLPALKPYIDATWRGGTTFNTSVHTDGMASTQYQNVDMGLNDNASHDIFPDVGIKPGTGVGVFRIATYVNPADAGYPDFADYNDTGTAGADGNIPGSSRYMFAANASVSQTQINNCPGTYTDSGGTVHTVDVFPNTGWIAMDAGTAANRKYQPNMSQFLGWKKTNDPTAAAANRTPF